MVWDLNPTTSLGENLGVFAQSKTQPASRPLCIFTRRVDAGPGACGVSRNGNRVRTKGEDWERQGVGASRQ